ncbi:gpW family head-tail joining protein [Halomonas elongata]|uniref:gpW family head-tail joining protein n=1 Tax=Halomonas elongata TaxID=2746 RepID=UPI00255AB127|nr:gpW family head-tail joining protein [Halomonas elongata]MDL4861439.1 gpW family head-tail joining protein [Halomonas elongata]
MAYTEDDLAEVRRAILDLTTGKRVARITYNGRTVEYSGSGDLTKLREVERQIVAYLASNKRRTRTRSVRTSKGL